MIQSHSLADDPVALDEVRLLVVEDELDARCAIVSALQSCGAEVEAVGSLHEGLIAVQRYRPDILISNLDLPDGDGYALISMVRTLEAEQHVKRMPAIAISTSVKDVDLTQAVVAGFQRYLAKPIEPHRLIAAVVSLGK